MISPVMVMIAFGYLVCTAGLLLALYLLRHLDIQLISDTDHNEKRGWVNRKVIRFTWWHAPQGPWCNCGTVFLIIPLTPWKKEEK